MREVASGLLDDLERALRRDENPRHEKLLQNLVEHFAATARSLGTDHVELFDILILRLLGLAAMPARADVSRRFAPLEVAPPASLVKLANDHITVAAPVLLRSPCLSDEALRDIAQSAGQAHLLAISRRAVVSQRLTDALLTHGTRSVLGSLAHNPGARFSPTGAELMLASAADDPAIQQVLARRADMPARDVRAVLEQASRDMASMEESRNREGESASGEADAGTVRLRTMPAAMIRVASLAVEAGGLSETVVAGFAREGQRLELMCALATLTRMPLPVVEKALDADRPGAVILMARALNFTFNTIRLILRLRPQGLPARGDLEMLQKEFEDMTPAKAWSAIGFMASRRDGVAAA